MKCNAMLYERLCVALPSALQFVGFWNMMIYLHTHAADVEFDGVLAADSRVWWPLLAVRLSNLLV